MKFMLSIIIIGLSLGAVSPVQAESVADEPTSWWLTSGFVSHHHQNNHRYRENNTGIGGEWHVTPSWRLHVGHYKNSVHRRSNYLQGAWMPLHLGAGALHLRLGASVGVVNGYPQANGGGYIPTLVPTLELSYHRVGMNLVYIPTVGGRVDGAVAVQFKLRLR
jgi:hypothetical protein